MHDARALQATYPSPAAFYKEHGFCLLQHHTEVKEWNTNYMKFDAEVSTIYHKEIENLVKTQLYPADSDKILNIDQPAAVIRRGRDIPNNDYAGFVHQDYGTNPTEFAENFKAYAGEAYAG